MSGASVRRLALIVGVLASTAAVLVVIQEPWHGPTLLRLSSTHGVDAGDLLVVPLVALLLLSNWLAARGSRSASQRGERLRDPGIEWWAPRDRHVIDRDRGHRNS